MPRTHIHRPRWRVLAALCLLACLTATPTPVAAAEMSEAEYAQRTILCDCGCHPQSTYDCACGRAAEMRAEIAARVDTGLTGEQVVEEYVAEFGEQIRVSPTATGFNLVAWAGPFFVLVFAGLLVAYMLRRWARARAVVAEGETTAPVVIPDADDPYVSRLQARLKELE